MNIFNRTKIIKNDRITYYRFASKHFTSSKITEICLHTGIDEFFVEIFGLTKNESLMLETKLLVDKIKIVVNSNKQKKWHVVHLTVSKIKGLIEYIEETDYKEILIWDAYASLDQFLLHRKNLNTNNAKQIDSKFYLDFNRFENGYGELYLDPKIDDQNIQMMLRA